MTNSESQDNLSFAIILALAGFFASSVSDLVVKGLGGAYGVFQLLVTLPFVAALLLLITAFILKKQDMLIAKQGLKWQIIRGMMTPIGSMAVLYALPMVSLSSFYAVVFSAPIITSVLSIVFLKEKVMWQRWFGIFIGFIGILIVIRPGAGDFNVALLYVLLAAFLFSVGSVLVRRFSQGHSAIGYAFVTTTVHAFCALGIFLVFGDGYKIPPPQDALLFLACGVCMGLASFLIPKGIMMAQASIIAPFHYSQMIWGILFGYIFFSELPDIYTISGASIVIASGLYIWHRENLMRKAGQRYMLVRRTIIAVPRRKKDKHS